MRALQRINRIVYELCVGFLFNDYIFSYVCQPICFVNRFFFTYCFDCILSIGVVPEAAWYEYIWKGKHCEEMFDTMGTVCNTCVQRYFASV